MFIKGSRYEGVEEYAPLDSTGQKNRVKKIRRIPDTNGRFMHTIKEGDRLDLLASIYYKNPTAFWHICDANNMMYPGDLLEKGKKIIIPPGRS